MTNVLASYRGFDTLGEVVVVFTAGIGVIILLTGSTLSMRFEKTENVLDQKSKTSKEET